MHRISAPPPARAEGLVVERIDDEVVIYDLETKEAHCLRPLAAVVFDQCDGTTTVDEIAAVAEKQLATAAPLVTSIVAPTAAMAASGIATGCAGCGKNPDCVSNHCCQDNAGKQCQQGCCVGANNSCHACPLNCGPAPAPPCQCTVAASEIPGGCPCICGTPGCVNVPCCPTQNLSCCTPTPAC